MASHSIAINALRTPKLPFPVLFPLSTRPTCPAAYGLLPLKVSSHLSLIARGPFPVSCFPDSPVGRLEPRATLDPFLFCPHSQVTHSCVSLASCICLVSICFFPSSQLPLNFLPPWPPSYHLLSGHYSSLLMGLSVFLALPFPALFFTVTVTRVIYVAHIIQLLSTLHFILHYSLLIPNIITSALGKLCDSSCHKAFVAVSLELSTPTSIIDGIIRSSSTSDLNQRLLWETSPASLSCSPRAFPIVHRRMFKIIYAW